MSARDLAMAAALMVGLGLSVLLFFAPSARAAERFLPGPHEIVLFLPPLEHEPDRRTIFILSDPKTDRAACEKAKARLVVKAKGGKLVCHPVETVRVR